MQPWGGGGNLIGVAPKRKECGGFGAFLDWYKLRDARKLTIQRLPSMSIRTRWEGFAFDQLPSLDRQAGMSSFLCGGR